MPRLARLRRSLTGGAAGGGELFADTVAAAAVAVAGLVGDVVPRGTATGTGDGASVGIGACVGIAVGTGTAGTGVNVGDVDDDT